jgi:voltage-gated potassium channel
VNGNGATDWRRFRVALTVLAGIMIVGTIGYLILGFRLLDAVYQAVTTLTTVGFREVHPLSDAGKVFTIILILCGVGTALYALGVLIQTLVEGDLRSLMGRKRMEHKITDLHDHVIVCGWGRVGRAIAKELGDDTPIVVVDRDAERLEDSPHPWIAGDVTDDAVLLAAGLPRARALVAALDTDAGNLFVTLSARTLCPDVFIVARVRVEESVDKLVRAGANRVVNPQSIGGARMAAFVLQPHVTEFLDVVMHDRDLEFRLEEFTVPDGSGVVGRNLRDAQIRDLTGALVLALRNPAGEFVSNPAPEQVISGGDVLIAIGTPAELGALGELVGS